MTPPENDAHDNPAAANLQPAMGALPCDAHHHYYHYQSSAQYLLLARACFALGRQDEAMEAIEKALFQDHFNEEALALKACEGRQEVAQSYDKHPMMDADFCASVGKQQDDTGRRHDEAIALWQQGDAEGALTKLAENPTHSNSRFARARIYFAQQDYAKAYAELKEAVKLSHVRHDAYHRTASDAHVERARAFAANGRPELALNDYAKALDLDRTNETAKAEMQMLKNLRGSG